jgi:hypothetical protein
MYIYIGFKDSEIERVDNSLPRKLRYITCMYIYVYFSIDMDIYVHLFEHILAFILYMFLFTSIYEYVCACIGCFVEEERRL